MLNFQFNLRGGLSIQLVDQLLDTYDRYATDPIVRREKDKYLTNLTSLSLYYSITDRIYINLDYTYFLVDYDEKRSESLNRTDDTIAGNLFFQWMPKTSFFTGFDTIRVTYDDKPLSENTRNNYYVGLQWDITDKSRGRIRLGYSNREYENRATDTSEDLFYEIQLNHNFTDTTSLNLTAYRRENETDTTAYPYRLSHHFRASYLQEATSKLTLGLRASYAVDEYDGETPSMAASGDREDNLYTINPYVLYAFADWLSMRLSYEYEESTSDDPENNYKVNSVMMSIYWGI